MDRTSKPVSLAPKGATPCLSLFLLPLTALLFLAVAVLGTERLGRRLTAKEKRRLGALLREHDYPGMRLVALRFAYKSHEEPGARAG